MNSKSKTVSVSGISSFESAKTPETKKYLSTVKEIADILMNTKEWKSLPEYEHYYE
jgi:hypothetical protein